MRIPSILVIGNLSLIVLAVLAWVMLWIHEQTWMHLFLMLFYYGWAACLFRAWVKRWNNNGS